MKKFFKDKLFRIWFSVTGVLVALMLTIGIVAGTALYDVIKNVLGREIAIYEQGMDRRYVPETESKTDAFVKANKKNEELCEEGSVLLKNDSAALPLEEGAKISVFGKNSVNLVYGGSGSGGGNENGRVGLYSALRDAGFDVNGTLENFYNDTRRSGEKRPENSSDLDSGADVNIITGETPYSYYGSDVRNSYADYNDAAIIVLSRIGGEGFDLPRQSEGDENRHYLELDPNEVDLVKNVTSAGFEKVVVVINSAAVMELDWVESGRYGAVDACLWIGAPGNSGISALGRILKGDVNPSGKTVDTWATDLLAMPAVENFGSNGTYEGDAYLIPAANGKIPVDNKTGRPIADYYYVSYEEGIYVGYRYYETRANSYAGAVSALGESEYADGEEWYDANVVYPFGHGLSYTTFKTEIAEKQSLGTELNANGKIELTVNVTNTDENNTKKSGKEVVQVYVTAPYKDGVGGRPAIEKAHKVLCGFAKTPLLAPGESAPIVIEIDPYSFASYDYDGRNNPDYTGYILEQGEYIFTVGKNAHEAIDTFALNLAEDVRFDEGKVTNRFDDCDEELDGVLSRSNWNGTWPAKPTYEDRIRDNDLADRIESKNARNPETFDNTPATGAPVTVKMFDLIFDEEYKNYETDEERYNDKRWDDILDSLTVDEMVSLINHGAFNTQAILKIEKNVTIDADGPAGFTVFMGDPSVYETCAYASEVVMASTWNVELIYEMGQSVGEEGLWGNYKGDKTPYSGWYAPGANIHRTPFGGRNFEYFSEDSFISGQMAAYEIKGAASKGVYCYMKHFVANEQETHRSLTGLCTWLTEQSLREIYLRPFEIAVKEGNATGIMSSFNRLGTTWTGGDYRLLTEVLRNEWGFKGTVICDFNTNDYMSAKQMIYAGGDLNLANTPDRWAKFDANSAKDVTMLRRAAKNILYTVSCSNAMNAKIKFYLPPLWMLVTLSIMAAITIGLAVWGVFVIRGTLQRIKAASPEAEEGAVPDEQPEAI